MQVGSRQSAGTSLPKTYFIQIDSAQGSVALRPGCKPSQITEGKVVYSEEVLQALPRLRRSFSRKTVEVDLNRVFDLHCLHRWSIGMALV